MGRLRAHLGSPRAPMEPARVCLVVTGSVGAVKTPELVALLRESGLAVSGGPRRRAREQVHLTKKAKQILSMVRNLRIPL